ncbi:hypothetical protein Y1Q_0009591 [Alligator mississippiensis]|uniref:Uncharacterized protein n=1 Tax=Alligator mississippiensis TaxID=8496 RepID=A0A151NVW9_ALLMI|nr:hypothetical protein Y1Q_0009591 [Alligator mississippiensis]
MTGRVLCTQTSELNTVPEEDFPLASHVCSFATQLHHGPIAHPPGPRSGEELLQCMLQTTHQDILIVVDPGALLGVHLKTGR